MALLVLEECADEKTLKVEEKDVGCDCCVAHANGFNSGGYEERHRVFAYSRKYFIWLAASRDSKCMGTASQLAYSRSGEETRPRQAPTALNLGSRIWERA